MATVTDLVMVVEDGSGKADSNSYASVEDGDAYHTGHLYADAWAEAIQPNLKAAALVMATRLIDAYYQFGGVRAVFGQALQWPRLDCPEPDGSTSQFVMVNEPRVPSFVGSTLEWAALSGNAWLLVPGNVVPGAVVEATIEFARELLVADRTAAWAGEGLKYTTAAGAQVGYDPTTTRPVIPYVAQAMLTKYGSLVNAKSGSVRLVRT